jgi:hypothetical protein
MRCPDMYDRAKLRIGAEGGYAQNAFVLPSSALIWMPNFRLTRHGN